MMKKNEKKNNKKKTNEARDAQKIGGKKPEMKTQQSRGQNVTTRDKRETRVRKYKHSRTI